MLQTKHAISYVGFVRILIYIAYQRVMEAQMWNLQKQRLRDRQTQ